VACGDKERPRPKGGRTMSAITISRQLASLGTKIAQAVAGIEGVHRVDNQLLVTEYYRFGT